MKLIDPIGGLKLMSYCWPVNLTLIIGFIFIITYFDDD